MTWEEIYRKEIGDDIESYFKRKINKKKKLVNLVKKYSDNKRILEAGCGTGILSIYFANSGYEVTAVDIDNDILNLSKEVLNKLNLDKSPCYIQNSILNLSNLSRDFDVSFSSGVLEHFSDKEIETILKEQAALSKFIIFAVPSKYFSKKTATYGDERYLSTKKWKSLIKQSGLTIKEIKYMHYLNFRKRLVNIKKIFKPKPFIIFIVKGFMN